MREESASERLRREIHALSSGLLPSAPDFHRICAFPLKTRPRASDRGRITAGGDLHPALRVLVFFNIPELHVKGKRGFFGFSGSLMGRTQVWGRRRVHRSERRQPAAGRRKKTLAHNEKIRYEKNSYTSLLSCEPHVFAASRTSGARCRRADMFRNRSEGAFPAWEISPLWGV